MENSQTDLTHAAIFTAFYSTPTELAKNQFSRVVGPALSLTGKLHGGDPQGQALWCGGVVRAGKLMLAQVLGLVDIQS